LYPTLNPKFAFPLAGGGDWIIATGGEVEAGRRLGMGFMVGRRLETPTTEKPTPPSTSVHFIVASISRRYLPSMTTVKPGVS